MGSCVSLNYCNRGSRRSNHRTNENGEVRDVNQQQQQTNGQMLTSEQINLTVNTATGPTASTVDSSRTTAGASACHRSPSFSNRTSNSFQSTCSTQRRNSPSLMNNAVIIVNNNNNNNNNNNPSTNINTGGNNFHFIPPTGKNKRLKKDYLKYLKYDKRISESQLKAKREEFWDTAPAFDGKPEIWAALKAAVDALESKNYQLAQAIIDSANIILPNGFINDCYDELGNRYQLPVYVLVKPTHLRLRQAANEPDSNTSSSNKPHSAQNKKKSNKKSSNKNKRNKKHDSDDCDEDDDSVDASDDSDQNELDFDDYDDDDYDDGFFFRPSSKQKQPNKGKKSNSSGAQPTTSKSKKENAVSDVAAATTTIATSVVDEEPIQVKFRISTMNQDSNNSDIKLMVSLNETVLSVKKKLFEQFKIEPASQRFFFAGKLLKDKDKLRSHKLKKNVVVQVIVREQPQQQQQQPLAPPTTVEDKTQLNKCSTPTATTTISS